MPNVELYSTDWCPFCRRAEKLLSDKGIGFTKIKLDDEPGRKEELVNRSGRRTVPQIFIAGLHIGGCDDLFAIERSGQLDKLLSE
ncbi:MAG: glutaredoxin 3 [Betaproteobacteria bacterium]